MTGVSNRLLHDWLQPARVRGHDLRALLGAAGIPWHCYQNTRSHINGEQLARLDAEILKSLNDRFMGCGHEAAAPALMDRVLIKILARARTLQELLLEWQDFWNLVQKNGIVSSNLSGNEFIYRFKFNARQRSGTYVWILHGALFKLRLFSWMTGTQIKPKAIGIAEPAAAAAADCLALLPGRVLFDQAQNFCSIGTDSLHAPVIRTPEECLNYKQYLPADFFAIPDDERSAAAAVQRTVKDMLRTQLRFPGIECVAEALSVSVRELSRRLQREGETFQKLKHQMRHDLAVEKLACAELPIGEIAADLGFSETAAFCRAFKSWTASTPREYRARLALRQPSR